MALFTSERSNMSNHASLLLSSAIAVAISVLPDEPLPWP
jgi:hypothetical protein